jgi:hypothetical protein
MKNIEGQKFLDSKQYIVTVNPNKLKEEQGKDGKSIQSQAPLFLSRSYD